MFSMFPISHHRSHLRVSFHHLPSRRWSDKRVIFLSTFLASFKRNGQVFLRVIFSTDFFQLLLLLAWVVFLSRCQFQNTNSFYLILINREREDLIQLVQGCRPMKILDLGFHLAELKYVAVYKLKD